MNVFTPLHIRYPTQIIPNFRGPDGQRVIVALGWHMDAESGLLGGDRASATHMGALTESAYGVSMALPRILELHKALGVPASFFVPGYVCDTYPREIAAIADAGSEIAHHGYPHENCFRLNDTEQRDVFEHGIESIRRVCGKTPVGWSAPSWGVRASTLDLMADLGFLYDSSLMEYDTPYVVTTGKGPLIELPISMVLDDWEIFGSSPYPGGGVNAPAEAAFQIWKEEFDGLLHYGGLFATSFHPNLTGRPGRLRMLARLIEYMQSHADVWFATSEQVAHHAAHLIKAPRP